MTETTEFPPLPPEWTFTCNIQQPDGVRAECVIYVPETAEYHDVLEVSEVAQMAAVSALGILRRTRTASKRTAF
jgi:hypothetical protein